MSARAAVRAVAAIAVAATLSSGCAVNGLSFREDTRVDILAPSENTTVRLPFIVQWEARDFDGYFAVFFDRSPMRPGRDLRSLVPRHDPCRAERACPDARWLAGRDTFITTDLRLVVDWLPDRRDSRRSKDRHELTIVLLDEAGSRLGESAFIREFIVERDD